MDGNWRGCRLSGPRSGSIAKLVEGGLLTVAAGDNVVRLVPPLIIEDSHVDEALSIIDKAAEELGSDPETGRD